MLQDQTLAVVQEIFQAIFMQDNPYTLSELRTKFASSLQLPELVPDSTTGEPTYSILPSAAQYITCANSEKRSDTNGWILTDKSPTSDIDQLEKIWHDINSITTERVFNSENVHASDPIYNCTNIYSSTNCGDSHYLIYCSGTFRSRYALASKRSDTLNYCINVDDSNSCTNSYQVICSSKISNSLFIQDCGNLHECIWCSHIANQEYCIANIQFSQSEYYELKPKIIDRILRDI